MAPGDVAHVPRTPSPVAEASLIAKHFRSRARLRRLLAGLRPSTSHRSLRSLRRRGFAHYVRLRHYRSSLFCCRKIIPSHSFAALTALIVRRVKGGVALLIPHRWALETDRCFACASCRATPKGVKRAPGSGTLPHFAALAARRQNSQFFPIISASGVDISSFLLHN